MAKNLKEYLIRVVTDARGDDLERARMAFRGLSEKEMDQQHGQSGQTRRDLLRAYEENRSLHDAAVSFLRDRIAG
jgi:hypothetical protein